MGESGQHNRLTWFMIYSNIIAIIALGKVYLYKKLSEINWPITLRYYFAAPFAPEHRRSTERSAPSPLRSVQGLNYPQYWEVINEAKKTVQT